MKNLVNFILVSYKFFRKIPLKFMLAIILLSLWVDNESYPISKFPMYSAHPQKTFFVNVTDENDRVIPVISEFGMTTSHLTKVYKTRFEERFPDAKKPDLYLDINKSVATKVTLDMTDYMFVSRQPRVKNPSQYNALKFWHNSIYRDEAGKVVLKKELIAEHQIQ